MTEEQVRKHIKELLDSQLLAVLSTHRHGQPYANLIAFAHCDDLATLIFATAKPTRKFTNLMAEPRVSLMVDNRSNDEDDFHKATAVTIIGTVAEAGKEEIARYKGNYLKRHPYLAGFVNLPTTAILKVAVQHYILVSSFQNVMELHLTDEEDIFP